MASTRRDIKHIKPVPSQVPIHVNISPSDPSTPPTSPPICGVCHRAKCRLPSHRAYLANQRQCVTERATTKSNEAEDRRKVKLPETSYARSYAYTRALPSLGAGRLDGFNDLPVPGGHQLDLHQSVYNLLHSKIGAATAFPLPLGLAVNEIGGSMVIPVMTDTSLCLSVIAAWKAVQFLAGQTSAFPHLSYEAQALQSLRQKLLEQGQAAVTDEAILAAALLWASATMFAQPDALKRHAAGVRALVTARGGLRGIGQAGSIGQAASIKQLILWADFLTAQFLGEEVLFPDIGPADPMPPSLTKLSQAITIPLPMASLRSTTLKAARELKLLLVSHDAATRTGRVSIAEYKALMSLLNRSTIERINLDHQLKNSDLLDECLMLAMNLIRLTVLFHAGPLFTIVVSVISRLRNALKRTTLERFIETSPDGINLYIWACFIGLVNGFDSENRSYFVELLSSAMDIKYEESGWPENWRTQNLDMLRSFIWSDTVLTRLYFEACQMIEARMLTPTSQKSMW